MESKDAKKAQPLYKEGEVLVKFKKGVASSDAKITASSYVMSVAKEFMFLSQRRGQGYLLLKSERMTTEEMVAVLKEYPGVEEVSPNYTRKICETFPDDSLFDQLWGLHNVGQDTCGFGGGISDADVDAPEAWDVQTGNSDVVVAVIDTGVDYTHEDLAANMWVNDAEANGTPDVDDDGNGYVDDIYGYDFASDNTGNNDSDPMDIHYHGTHVAGTIAAVGNNSIGVVGVNWDAQIMALKGMRPDEYLYDSDIIEAIEYIVYMKTNYGVNVVAINASWGGYDYNDLLEDTVDTAGEAGIVFVAAAGNEINDNDAVPFYPCAYDSTNILCVAATDHSDGLANFSNYGINSVDLGAPGDWIFSTVPGYTPGGVGDLFFDDMEGGDANWIHGGINDSWAITEEYSSSPTHAWSDSPGGNYLAYTDSYLAVSHNIDLSGTSGQNLMLGFWARGDLEFYFDYLNVDISNDDGGSWQTISSLTGYSASWDVYSFPIPEDYRTSEFRFRFHLITYFNTGDGIYIDDVGIGSGGGAYECLQGTSMAAPHVTGAVALMAAEYPAEDLHQRIDRILLGVDVLPSLAGEAATEGRLNLANSISGVSSFCSEDDTGNLDIKGANGNTGSTVIHTVRIQDAPNAVDSLGFEVTYDPAVLQYTGYSRGDCVADFDFFDCTEPSPGVVRCGGFEADQDIIPQGESCDVVDLQFTVLKDPCECRTSSSALGLRELVDDLVGWSTSHGCFCCGCSCDINGDGQCTPQDALCSFQVYLGICLTACGDCEDICCDVNGDGQCTPADALCRFQEYLEIHPNCFDQE